MKRAALFPGQGSQQVGMGKALADAYAPAVRVFEEVDDALSEKLSDLIWNGPEDELKLTRNAQPALMAVSLAVVRTLEDMGLPLAETISVVAGHSLGEYSALAAAGSLSLADTARLLRLRGDAMQRAVPVGEGAMAAIMGPSLEEAEAIARKAAASQVCVAANDNAPGQVVVSGHRQAVERAVEIAKEQGARAVLLPVSAPFHSPLMQPAADAMHEALSETEIKPPAVPLYANVSAKAETDAAEIRTMLVEQVTGRVRWRETIEAMQADGIGAFAEMGAGKVLSGILKRIDRRAAAWQLEIPESLEAFAKEIKG